MNGLPNEQTVVYAMVLAASGYAHQANYHIHCDEAVLNLQDGRIPSPWRNHRRHGCGHKPSLAQTTCRATRNFKNALKSIPGEKSFWYSIRRLDQTWQKALYNPYTYRIAKPQMKTSTAWPKFTKTWQIMANRLARPLPFPHTKHLIDSADGWEYIED